MNGFCTKGTLVVSNGLNFFYLLKSFQNVAALFLMRSRDNKPISCHWSFLYLLKTSGNLCYSDVFRGIDRDKCNETGS